MHLFFLYSAISNIVLIASSFADSINPQVLITIISALDASLTILNFLFLNIPIAIWVSTKFLLHPNDINPTFIVTPLFICTY